MRVSHEDDDEDEEEDDDDDDVDDELPQLVVLAVGLEVLVDVTEGSLDHACDLAVELHHLRVGDDVRVKREDDGLVVLREHLPK